MSLRISLEYNRSDCTKIRHISFFFSLDDCMCEINLKKISYDRKQFNNKLETNVY